ncbi:MAG: ankyrin repeat domain-containing protein, partial [Parachlamydiaceae bacterium]|nr:ankyrin repeat domain-containing protein [Parachlamydiaceae bacterium]
FDLHLADYQGDTILHYAAQNGSNSLIKYLIKNGANPNALNQNRQTPLHVFCSQTYNTDELFETIKYFVQYGGDIYSLDNNDSTPLGKIFNKPSVSFEMIKELIEFAGITDFSEKSTDLLHKACANGRLDIVEFLIKDLKHSPNNKNCLGLTPLHIAVIYLDLKIVDFLLLNGANPSIQNNNGLSPIHMLNTTSADIHAYNFWEEITDYEVLETEQTTTNQERQKIILDRFLQHGLTIDQKDKDGRTPFLLACSHIHQSETQDLVRILIEMGTDIFAKDNQGNSAIHYLFEKSIPSYDLNKLTDFENFLMSLIQKGLSLEDKNYNGETTLFKECSSFSLRVEKIDFLIKLGADIKTIDNKGRTILDVLKLYGFTNAENLKYLHSKNISLFDKDEHSRSIFNKGFYFLTLDDLDELFKVVDINSSDKEGSTFLHLILKDTVLNFLDIELLKKINKMIDLGADVKALNLKAEPPVLMTYQVDDPYLFEEELEFINILKNKGMTIVTLN